MMTFKEAKELVSSYGYNLCTWYEFILNANSKLVFRALEFADEYVLWDPNDDEDGFLLIGNYWQHLVEEWIEVNNIED